MYDITKPVNMKEKIYYSIAMLTYPAWHPLVDVVLNHCYRMRIITGAQLHAITARLDRTQVHCCLRKASKRSLP